MFALCIESSHQKGMGHLYRALNFIDFINGRNEPSIVFINNNEAACDVLNSRGMLFETVDLTDCVGDWETGLISKHGIDVWVNDRLDTDIRHARNIKKNGVKLVTFDDRGSGAELADIHVAALAFAREGQPKGRNILAGLDYLILNREIAKYKRVRTHAKNIIVTLGGSDTYGVTLKVVGILKGLNKKATVHIGPSFKHRKELEAMIDKDFHIISNVPSLMEEFSRHDLAITGGGMTPFEANASGLPCIIIANEIFEIPNARLLSEIGSSVFAGYHKDINTDFFKMELDIEKMSIAGMDAIKLNGAENVYRQIREL